MRYLYDFAQWFYIMFAPLVMVLSGGLVAVGMVLAFFWGLLPHVVRRL